MCLGHLSFTPVTSLTPLQTQGLITSGVWNPNAKTYSALGTTTSDELCGVTGSPFSISGIIGPEVPITMDQKHTFQGTGNIAATNAKA